MGHDFDVDANARKIQTFAPPTRSRKTELVTTMSLTESQCKHLRGLGHHLKPLVLIGSAGLSDGVLAEINSSLEHHELIKVRVRSGGRKERDELIANIANRASAQLIQRIGNVALIYRAAEKPTIVLPNRGQPAAPI